MKLKALAAVLASTSLLLFSTACEETPAAGSASASAAPAPTPKPTPTPKASTPPSAEPVAAPRDDCPKDSKGGGTLTQPCEGSGVATRMMEVKYLNKSDEKGPFFNVKNINPLTVLYGQVNIYFYDKAGKQLDTKDGKKKKTCASSNLFVGPMKKDELFKIQFACLKKDGVPDNVDAIEAEIDVVGFTDKADEKKVDMYWRNKDLAPDERPKGGVPAKK